VPTGGPNQDEPQEGDILEEHREDNGEFDEDFVTMSARCPTQELSRKISLPVLPTPTVDTPFSVDSILGAINTEDTNDFAESRCECRLFKGIVSSPNNSTNKKQQQRMSRVLQLREENEKLEAELKALRERIAAAEEKSQSLTQKTANAGDSAHPSLQ
jgi:hypothetical protein